ncbi:hypothetical protein [Caballeronia sp. NK8]|nr:hypothetical protein [Caballeronia sp. NK8]
MQHVTKPGTNIFTELGFSADEACRYYDESQALIGQTLKLEAQRQRVVG